MKTYKLIDIITGDLLIVVFTILLMINFENYFLAAYSIVGGWQVCSALAHRVNQQKFIPGQLRKIYERLLITLIVAGVLCFLLSYLTDASSLLIYLYILLFVSPAYAVYYQVVCHLEYRLLTKRAFIHLKN